MFIFFPVITLKKAPPSKPDHVLLGLIFALLFCLIYLNSDTAFNGIEDNLAWYIILPEFVYFSFVTLTTLGYGDISPVQPLAKFMVYIEAIIGQFYLAILVASLVGSSMSSIYRKQSH